MKKYLLAIDQGTTGSRAFLFDASGNKKAEAYREFRQYYPKPGWVEHDAEEIWNSCVTVIREVLHKNPGAAKSIAAIGITNQRETCLLWDRKTSQPIYHAIVWQCRRTAETCRQLKKKGKEAAVRKKTGLLLDPYFSGTKLQWMFQNIPGARSKAAAGKLCFGTIDTWLLWKLTGGKSHKTDMTNASRTLLFDIRKLKWDDALLKTFQVPQQVLPRVQNSGSLFGHTVADAKSGLPAGIPITGIMGDQQAALYGQGCYVAGQLKNTYGTGCFLVLNTGKKRVYSKKGLLTTIVCDKEGKPVYGLEGAVFIAGAVVQWLRDELKIIQEASETDSLIHGLESNEGVYFVPAFTGLGAPYWESEARGLLCGLTRGTGRKQIVRAALEAIAYQTKDIFEVMQEAFGKPIRELLVDGGASMNSFLMQFQSDLLRCRVVRPEAVEATVVGVARLAGKTRGVWKERSSIQKSDIFKPKMPATLQKKNYDGWKEAVAKTLTHSRGVAG